MSTTDGPWDADRVSEQARQTMRRRVRRYDPHAMLGKLADHIDQNATRDAHNISLITSGEVTSRRP